MLMTKLIDCKAEQESSEEQEQRHGTKMELIQV
jgi:hypothetical protein